MAKREDKAPNLTALASLLLSHLRRIFACLLSLRNLRSLCLLVALLHLFQRCRLRCALLVILPGLHLRNLFEKNITKREYGYDLIYFGNDYLKLWRIFFS